MDKENISKNWYLSHITQGKEKKKKNAGFYQETIPTVDRRGSSLW